jgi:hypothetical protein
MQFPSNRLCILHIFSLSLPAKKNMEISGKIIAILPLQTGEGRNGQWRSQDYILETQEQYPKKVCFNLFGAKIDQFPLAVNEEVKISFDIESREWNGRWFTSIRAWKVDKLSTEMPVNDEMPPYFNDAPPPLEVPPLVSETPEAGNDLPF